MPAPEESAVPTQGRFFYGWIVALACMTTTFANGGLFLTSGVFFKPLEMEFGWSRGQLAMTGTIFLVAYAPGAFIWGRLADRYGPRRVLGLAALFIGLGFFLASRAQSLGPLLVAYALIGFGMSPTLTLPVATTQRWFIHHRGLMVGVVLAAGGVGGLIFPLLVNHLITANGWRSAYWMMGIVYGLLVAAAASLMEHSPERRGLRPYGAELAGSGSQRAWQNSASLSTSQALRSPLFWGVVALFVLNFMPSSFLSVHLIPYAMDKGVSAAGAVGALGLVAGLGVPGRLLMGGAADRIGWTRVMALSSLFLAASFIWMMFVEKSWMLYLFVLVYGFFNGGIMTLLTGAVGVFLGTAALGQLLGLALGISVLTAAMSPLIGGFIFDWSGTYFWALVLSVGAYLVAGFTATRLKRPGSG